ncbi:unnamed protein product [Paramecium sonneborni]|uniref:Uncharacterized protein n=1 Tax=Paramecium sonneborni TaxID=65129 RepID=A0A8S1RV43_9CILI|nr:unnamed protein product [Paramecium sonneborni]
MINQQNLLENLTFSRKNIQNKYQMMILFDDLITLLDLKKINQFLGNQKYYRRQYRESMIKGINLIFIIMYRQITFGEFK